MGGESRWLFDVRAGEGCQKKNNHSGHRPVDRALQCGEDGLLELVFQLFRVASLCYFNLSRQCVSGLVVVCPHFCRPPPWSDEAV